MGVKGEGKIKSDMAILSFENTREGVLLKWTSFGGGEVFWVVGNLGFEFRVEICGSYYIMVFFGKREFGE